MKVIKRGEIVESTFDRTKGQSLQIVEVKEIIKNTITEAKKIFVHVKPEGVVYSCIVNGFPDKIVDYHDMYIKEYDNTKYETYPYVEDKHTGNKNDWGF